MGIGERPLGVHISPAAFQSEGLAPVLDRIQAAGATAIDTGTTLFEPSEAGVGRREPPLDVDGVSRVLDRPLWGQRELWMRGYRSYDPDLSLYEATPYHPTQGAPQGGHLAGGGAAPPVHLDRDLVHKVLAEAHTRGLSAHLTLSPLLPPGLRPEDQPHYVDGSLPDPARRVAGQGCPNNPSVRAYATALARDTVRHYPEADGLFLDWVEFTVYNLEDHLACFCPYCAERAAEAGIDWPTVAKAVQATWRWLHQLQPADLAQLQRAATGPAEVLERLGYSPGWPDLLRHKAISVARLYAEIRQAMDDEGANRMELGANGWAPPFNLSSGADYGRLAEVVSATRVKLYTFHWSVLPRWYGETLRAWNPTLPEGPLLDALVALLGLPDDVSPRTFTRYRIPAPDEAHPARPEAWAAKLAQAVGAASGRGPIHAYAHAYRPLAQWREMLRVVRESAVDGLWVQRYEYLSAAKLAALGELWP